MYNLSKFKIENKKESATKREESAMDFQLDILVETLQSKLKNSFDVVRKKKIVEVNDKRTKEKVCTISGGFTVFHSCVCFNSDALCYIYGIAKVTSPHKPYIDYTEEQLEEFDEMKDSIVGMEGNRE